MDLFGPVKFVLMGDYWRNEFCCNGILKFFLNGEEDWNYFFYGLVSLLSAVLES